ENARRIFQPVLLAPRQGNVPAEIFCADRDCLAFRNKQIRDIGLKRRVPAFMDSGQLPVNPYFGQVIDRAEMKHDPLSVPRLRQIEAFAVPYHIVELRVADAAQLALKYKRNCNRMRVWSRVSIPVPFLLLPDSVIIEGELPLPVQIEPIRTNKLRSWIFLSRNRFIVLDVSH